MAFFAPEKISERRRRTPEGYLLIEGTPIARTGIQLYAPGELDPEIKPDGDGMIRILRSPEEVFKPESMASYNGKPITNDHPDDLVSPDTWRSLSGGVVMNPRRGEGDQADLLVADLLITSADMIGAVEGGKVELSCGYLPEYREIGDTGKFEQANIIGNHVALVDAGRCGERCSIGDHSTCNHPTRGAAMAKDTLADRFMKMLGVKDKAALMKALDEEVPEAAAEPGGTHVHVHMGEKKEDADDPMMAMGKRMDALEMGMKDIGEWVKGERDAKAARDAEEAKKKAEEEATDKRGDAEAEAKELEEEAGEEGKGKARDAKDSAFLSAAWQRTIAGAEIVIPGLSPPAFAADAKPKSTLDALCQFRRKVIDMAAMDQVGRDILDEIMAGRTLDTKAMTCGKVRDTFIALVAAKRRSNNATSTSRQTGDDGQGGDGAIRSIADLSAYAAKHYAKPARAGR